MTGHARDLLTGANGVAERVSEATLRAEVDYFDGAILTAIDSNPRVPGLERLVGRSVLSRFRAGITEALAGDRDARSLLHLLVDDLPGAVLVSGYALERGGSKRQHTEPQRQHPDLCAGWRVGGTVLIELQETGRLPPISGPKAPHLHREDDLLAWHDLPRLPPDGTRRLRRLDVIGGPRLRVDAHFRDSHMGADGVETVVHEYEVTAAIDPRTARILEIAAVPHTLPFVECDTAAASPHAVVGHEIGELRSLVRREFVGPATCTHLNDTLRSMEDVIALARRLEDSEII